MTTEEIKLAEEWVDENGFCSDFNNITSFEANRELVNAFLAGLGADRYRWHKQDIDDIYDFIAEDWSVKYFVCIMKNKRRVTAIGNCDEGYNGDVSVNLFFDHEDNKYYMDDIVWWKEIILPKDGEEK